MLLGREMEGLDVPGRRVGDGEGREKREEPNNKGGVGVVEEALVPVECCRASRAEAEASF